MKKLWYYHHCTVAARCDLPVVTVINEEQCLPGFLIVKGGGDLLHFRGQAQAAKGLGIALRNVVAMECPDLLI